MENSTTLLGTHTQLSDLLALRFQKHASTASSRARVVGNRAGSKLSNIKGRGVDLAEVRMYQPGDDVRSMDWRVTARTNEPHTKIFREERERPTLVVIDQTQNMFFGSKARLKSVCAAEVGARVAWQTLAAGDRVGGVVVHNESIDVHRPYRTTKSVARLLNDLARANQALNRTSRAQHSILDVMLRIRRLAKHNFRVVVISDFAGDLSVWQEHLQGIARANQLIVVQVNDPIEAQLPPSDYYLVTTGEQRIAFFSGDPRVRERYAQRHAEHQQALQRICQHSSMRYVQVATTDENLEQASWL